jgi:maltooligosyltrehalose trehalohydrolase
MPEHVSESIRVWAPRAGSVRLVSGERRLDMERADGGWWTSPVRVPPETDYAFSLDGGEPLPDPRSPRQPHGVHEPSRTVDHGAFPWTDSGFVATPLAGASVYELHVGTFSPEGTFDGVAARLDPLLDLGITHVELMPVNGFSGTRGWGYDGVNLYAPHEAYGGPDGLKRLVDACHAKGLAVLLDVVYNHLGPEGNYLGRFGPYFTDRYRTPWGDAVNLDGPDSDEVRRFFCDNALMWLRDYHLDGLRIDAVHAIVDTSAVHILEQLAEEVDALERETGRARVLIAESNLNDPRIVRAPERGGYGIDAQWSDDLHHALHVVLTGERSGYYVDFDGLEDVAKALTDVYVYDGRYSVFRRRRHGRAATGLSGHSFLGYLQTHDQVGNRARGERIGHLASPGKVRAAAALVLCAPFVPMLFQGEEWAAGAPFQYFTDHRDPELARAVREGRRWEFAAFGWRPEDVPDPQDPATFERSRLDWSERDREPHASMLAWYRRLLELRRSHPALIDGNRDGVRVAFDGGAGWIRMERADLTVCANFSEAPARIPLNPDRPGTVILASGDGVCPEAGEVLLPGESAVILGL